MSSSFRFSRSFSALVGLPAMSVAMLCACGDSSDFQRNAPSGGAGGAAAGAGGRSSKVEVGGESGSGHRANGGSAASGAGERAGNAGAGGAPNDGCGSVPIGALYVDGEAGLDGPACGTSAAPCKTIQSGITQAEAKSALAVLIAEGTYLESLDIAFPVELHGGWRHDGDSWVPLCSDDDVGGAVTIVAPDTENETIRVHDAGAVRLARLTIRSKAVAEPGESIYGMFVTGASTDLVLEDVSASLVAAGAGEAGDKGADGGLAPTGCTIPGDGAAGMPGPVAELASPGTFSSDGYLPSDGEPGNLGEVGHNGPNGTALTLPNCALTDGVTCRTDTLVVSGDPGCGGLPGEGGTPGKGGGSSIGLFAWDATVVVTGGQLVAGDGGDGGLGGEPGLGGLGRSGSREMKGCGETCQYNAEAGKMTIIGGPTLVSAGTRGGNGGPGSAGGQGAGGHSYAIYQGGAARVSVQGTLLVPGDPGAGEVPGMAAERNL